MTNELFGWISVLAGVALGLYMGQKFQREDRLEGYDVFPPRRRTSQACCTKS